MRFFYWAERRFAKALARKELALYRAIRAEDPNLPRMDVYRRILLRRPGYDEERVGALLRQAEDGVSWWPHDKDLSLRDVVHYLAVNEYLEREKTERKGTHVVFRDIIDKQIPAEL
jgi:hypothetical protein